jgi:hypothetical protein
LAARLGSAAGVSKARLSGFGTSSMKYTNRGQIAADIKMLEGREPGLAMLAWSALLLLMILASATLPAIASAKTNARSAPHYNCEFSSSDPKRGEERSVRFSFDAAEPFSISDTYAFGHWVRTTIVTDDQVVEQAILFDNTREPDRPSAFLLNVLNRRDLSLHRQTVRIDAKTRERMVESDRWGVCVRIAEPKAR